MAVVVDAQEFKGAATATTIAGGITISDTTITLAASTNWPTGVDGNFVIKMDAGLSTEEKVLIASRSGNVLTVASGGRGYDGTSPAAHQHGASAEHCIDAASLQQLNKFALDINTNGARLDEANTFALDGHFERGLTVDGDDNLSLLRFRDEAAAVRAWIGTDEALGTVGDLFYSVGASTRAHRFLVDAGTEMFRISDTSVSSAQEVRIGPGAFDAGTSGAYLVIDGSGTATTYIEAKGGASDVALELRSKGTSGISLKPGGSEQATLSTTGVFSTLGAGLFGAGVFGAAAPYVRLGDLGGTTEAFIQVLGTATNLGLQIQAKGTGSVVITNQAGTLTGQFDGSGNVNTSNAETSLAVRHQQVSKRVYAGAADSGGAGFRLLRIGN